MDVDKVADFGEVGEEVRGGVVGDEDLEVVGLGDDKAVDGAGPLFAFGVSVVG